MRSFTTAVVLLSILSHFTSAHPSTFVSRAQTENVNIPISDLLKDSTIERSGKGDGKVYSVSVPESAAKKPASAGSSSKPDLIAGSKIGNPCANEPCCELLGHGNYFTQSYRWETKEWSQHLGVPRAISQPVCPPASVTNSKTVSYSYSINVQVGPDLKFGSIDILDKLGIRVGFSYTWGTATTVGYTATCSEGKNFPCVAVFTPRIGVIYGTGWIDTIGTDGKTVCKSTQKSEMQINVPVTDSETCSGGETKNPCGPEGVYDHCFVKGKQANDLCPRSSLDLKHPPTRICPVSVFDGPQ